MKSKPSTKPVWHIGDIYEHRCESTRVIFEVAGINYTTGVASLKMLSPYNPVRVFTQKKIPANWKLISAL